MRYRFLMEFLIFVAISASANLLMAADVTPPDLNAQGAPHVRHTARSWVPVTGTKGSPICAAAPISSVARMLKIATAASVTHQCFLEGSYVDSPYNPDACTAVTYTCEYSCYTVTGDQIDIGSEEPYILQRQQYCANPIYVVY